MKLDKYRVRTVFKGEGGETLTVTYSNRGEPYRQGANFDFDDPGQRAVYLFLDQREVQQLRDTLTQLLEAM